MVDMFALHDAGHKVRLEEIYVPIKWALDQNTTSDLVKKPLEHYTDIFEKENYDTTNFIILKGEPMAGKTTFVQKLCNDWAVSLTQNKHEDSLFYFKLLLPIVLRLVKRDSSLLQILQYQFDFFTN